MRRTLVTLAALAALAVPLTVHAAGPTAEHWGEEFAALGYPSSPHLLSPTSITLPGGVIQVATSNSTDYALLSNGQVWAWGLGTQGQLGDGTTTTSLTTPVQVQFPAGVTIAKLPTDAMPFDAGLALDSTGNVWGWGYTSEEALCLPRSPAEVLTPKELPLTHVTALAGAGDHAVYDAGGTLYSCGENHDGDLGDGSNTGSATPVAVKGMANQDVLELVASCDNSGALLADGDYYNWGFDGLDQLGDGQTGVSSDVPVLVNLPLPVTQVAEGASSPENGSTVVQLSDGSYRAWGDDEYGELGDGHTTNEASPIIFTPPAGVTYTLLAEGGATSYGVTATGAVYAWGQGTVGQIGNGKRVSTPAPTEVISSGVAQISSTAFNVTVLP
jgi:alpha-tubulin suppressor-like RCC1 family protein